MGNIFKDNDCGIRLKGVSDCVISENIILNNSEVGIAVYYFSRDNFIFNNRIINNMPGIELGNANYNIIIQNEITDNWGGIQLYDSGWNYVSRNNFIDNALSAFVSLDFRINSKIINTWSSNYWDRPRQLPKPISYH